MELFPLKRKQDAPKRISLFLPPLNSMQAKKKFVFLFGNLGLPVESSKGARKVSYFAIKVSLSLSFRHQQRLRYRLHGEQEHQPVPQHPGQGDPGPIQRQARPRPVQGVKAHKAAAGRAQNGYILPDSKCSSSKCSQYKGIE